MITVKLYGGLGNQMFQYAAGLALALRVGTQLRLDTSWFAVPHKNVTPRDYELSLFPNIQEPCGAFFKFYHNHRSGKMQRLIKLFHFDYEISLLDLCYEGNQDWTEYLLSTGKKQHNLFGYWQSEKYFPDQEEPVRHAFDFPELTGKQNLEFLQRTKYENVVSVHVRRTDYVFINGKYDPSGVVCTKDYYTEASKVIRNKNERKVVFAIFSDDMDWCRENLDFGSEVIYVDWNKGKQSFRDMQLMSMCSHHIIANSSFSWWGAWLNRSKEKTVIAPAKWIKGNDPFEKLHCPESWIRIG